MNFKEAYQKMLEGKKVRRKDWGSGQYYSLLKDKIFFIDRVIVLNITVEDTLADDWEIVEDKDKKECWKPQISEKYYYISAYKGGAKCAINAGDYIDSFNFSVGNFFKTKEEAEHMIEKLKIINELQKFAYENNEKEIDWNNFSQNKFYLIYDSEVNNILVDYFSCTRTNSFNIYFTSFEIAKKAIKTIGEDRIKKYYFDVEE